MLTMDDIVREGHPALREVATEVTFPLSDEEKKIRTRDARIPD